MARITEVGNRGKLSVEFNSIPEVFKVIDKLGWVPQRDKESDRSSSGNSDFYTFGDLAEAKDVFLNKPETIRSFSQNDDKLVTVESIGKDVEFDVTGDFLDIDKYLEGIPEIFGNAVMGNPRSTFCTINILDSFVSWTKPEYQIAKQKRVLRLVDWLESQNIRCQIILSGDSSTLYSSVIIKEFQDPFDLNHLAVGMHPDWLRRIVFLMVEQSKSFEHGYGSSVDYDNRMKAYKSQPEEGIYVYVGGYIPCSLTELDDQFDVIEQGIQKTIDDGMTFNEMPLTITGKVESW